MHKLNLPDFAFRTRDNSGQPQIFDSVRKKWIVLTPEEWVRQNCLRFLSEFKGYPASLMAIEKKVMINGLSQRFDLLVYDRKGHPVMVAEFKAPGVDIGQEVFNQAVRYNNTLQAPYVLVSNGITHYVSQINFREGTARYLTEIPDYESL